VRGWTTPKVIAAAAVGLLAAYLVVRGIAEFFTVNYADPASYRDLWGGPSLAGVLAVHSGPGLAVLAGMGVYLIHKVRTRRRQSTDVSRPLEHADLGSGG
jgi:hypothetical protein